MKELIVLFLFRPGNELEIELLSLEFWFEGDEAYEEEDEEGSVALRVCVAAALVDCRLTIGRSFAPGGPGRGGGGGGGGGIGET